MMDWRTLIESLDDDHLNRFRFDNTICMPASRAEVVEEAIVFSITVSAIFGEDMVKDLIERVR